MFGFGVGAGFATATGGAATGVVLGIIGAGVCARGETTEEAGLIDAVGPNAGFGTMAVEVCAAELGVGEAIF